MPNELIFDDWADYMPQSVMDTFTKEYGINIKYIAYGSQMVPDNTQLQSAEITLPLQPDRKWIFDDIWADFMKGDS
jgi:hypothetical protein